MAAHGSSLHKIGGYRASKSGSGANKLISNPTPSATTMRGHSAWRKAGRPRLPPGCLSLASWPCRSPRLARSSVSAIGKKTGTPNGQDQGCPFRRARLPCELPGKGRAARRTWLTVKVPVRFQSARGLERNATRSSGRTTKIGRRTTMGRGARTSARRKGWARPRMRRTVGAGRQGMSTRRAYRQRLRLQPVPYPIKDLSTTYDHCIDRGAEQAQP